MDLAARIQQLERLVEEAKSMPLSSSVLVSRDELLELVREMRDSLPEEIKQARWVVKDREELLAKARRDAESVVEHGQSEQLRLASREEVVKRAAEEAERILQEAREEARQIRLEAEDYVDAKLAQFEVAIRRIQDDAATTLKALGRTLDQVEAGRQKLRGAAHPAADLAPLEEEAAAPEAPPGPFDELGGTQVGEEA